MSPVGIREAATVITTTNTTTNTATATPWTCGSVPVRGMGYSKSRYTLYSANDSGSGSEDDSIDATYASDQVCEFLRSLDLNVTRSGSGSVGGGDGGGNENTVTDNSSVAGGERILSLDIKESGDTCDSAGTGARHATGAVMNEDEDADCQDVDGDEDTLKDGGEDEDEYAESCAESDTALSLRVDVSQVQGPPTAKGTVSFAPNQAPTTTASVTGYAVVSPSGGNGSASPCQSNRKMSTSIGSGANSAPLNKPLVRQLYEKYALKRYREDANGMDGDGSCGSELEGIEGDDFICTTQIRHLYYDCIGSCMALQDINTSLYEACPHLAQRKVSQMNMTSYNLTAMAVSNSSGNDTGADADADADTDTDTGSRSGNKHDGNIHLGYNDFMIWWRCNPQLNAYRLSDPQNQCIITAVQEFKLLDKGLVGYVSADLFHNVFHNYHSRGLLPTELTFSQCMTVLDSNRSGRVYLSCLVAWLRDVSGTYRVYMSCCVCQQHLTVGQGKTVLFLFIDFTCIIVLYYVVCCVLLLCCNI